MSIEAPKTHDIDIVFKANEIAANHHPFMDRAEAIRTNSRHKGCLCYACVRKTVEGANKELDWLTPDDAEYERKKYVFEKDKKGKLRVMHNEEVDDFKWGGSEFK